MIVHATIVLHDEPLLRVAVQGARDSTPIKIGNHLRSLVRSASDMESRDPRFDQFLLATAAGDWAEKAARGRRDAVAVVGCSMGRPCSTQDVPERYARRIDPDEPIMHLTATHEPDIDRTRVMACEIIKASRT